MADKAHRLTDEKLEEMEKRLSAIYSRAEKTVQKKTADYAKSIDEKSAELLQAYKDAETDDEKRKAQGILSIDGGTVYQLYEKEALENATMTAMVITTTEYLSLVDTLEDTEDTDPVVSEDTTEEEVLTRAQLTAKVTALETELAAAKILLGGWSK